MSSNNTGYYFDDHNNNNNRNDDDDPFFNFHNNPPQSHGDWNKRILYMAIISLTFVLFLVFALHIYARYVLRRQARRRLAIRRLSLTVAHSMESQNNSSSGGLHPSVISTLPTFIFKQKNTREQDQEQRHQDDDEEEACAVCLSGVEDEETVRLLPNCKHTFHVGCIDAWLASHSTCPVCRAKVEPTVLIRRIEPQPREGPIAIGGGAAAVTPPSAPPLLVDQQITITEGTSEGDSAKTSGASVSTSSRLSSFRRILSRERSSRRIQPFSHDGAGDHDVEHHDLETQ